jgi:hypothetical protein
MLVKGRLSSSIAAKQFLIYDMYIMHVCQAEAKMSRILIDLPDAQIEQLALLVQAEQRPRAAVIRDAIGAYIAQHKPAVGADIFGLWKSRKVDGLEYQQELRSQW